MAWLFRHIRIVHVPGLFSTVFWTVRSWLWSYPISPDYSIWEEGDPNERQAWEKERNRIARIWCFLHPFFASKGYECYIQRDPTTFTSQTIPRTTRTTPHPEVTFPYAHYCCENDEQVCFSLRSAYVWPARDKKGRDVVIKIMSGPIPTNELKANRLLGSDALRNDPRNHTVPVLEYIEFDGHIFAVMPRWSFADQGDFINVGELVRYGRAFFEVTAFLHEHKITHGDLTPQNLFMDVILPYTMEPRYAGLRGPQRRYGLIDFEASTLGPDDGSPNAPELEKAFKEDVSLLGRTLEINLRCIQDVIPGIVGLLDSMIDLESPSQPTAAAALACFEKICKPLSEEDLECSVETIQFSAATGHLEYRKGPPIYLSHQFKL